MNIRRSYGSLVVYQLGTDAKVDLTNYFFVGQQPMPAFGQMTEIVFPWDSRLDQKLVVEFNCVA